MTDLTEQWQKGELPEGWYYIKDENGVIYAAENCLNYDSLSDKGYTAFYYAETEISEILAKVPTYHEYLALQSDSLAKNEGAEIVAELEAKARKLKKDYKDLEFKYRSYKDFKETVYDLDTSRLEEEIKELKERNNSLNNRDINLCRIANEIRNENFALKELLKECKYELRGSYTDLGLEDWSLITKIDQALGEDK